MSDVTGNELLARQLKRAGVDTLFGVIAGPMIQAMGAAHREGIRFIGCRHEMNACFMASAWGYIKRKPGVVAVGSGPGMTNTVTPMYVARRTARIAEVFRREPPGLAVHVVGRPPKPAADHLLAQELAREGAGSARPAGPACRPCRPPQQHSARSCRVSFGAAASSSSPAPGLSTATPSTSARGSPDASASPSTFESMCSVRSGSCRASIRTFPLSNAFFDAGGRLCSIW